MDSYIKDIAGITDWLQKDLAFLVAAE